MSSPFTSYDQPTRQYGGSAPAPGFYWATGAADPYAYQNHTRQCETRGLGTGRRTALRFLIATPLGWLALCLIAVTGPVSVPALFAIAVAVAVLRPKIGTGKTRPAPSAPRQRNARPPTRAAWTPPHPAYKR